MNKEAQRKKLNSAIRKAKHSRTQQPGVHVVASRKEAWSHDDSYFSEQGLLLGTGYHQYSMTPDWDNQQTSHCRNNSGEFSFIPLLDPATRID